MAAQGALALGIVLVVVLLILVRRARTGRTGDDREDVRALIGKEIDAHIEALARSWLEARSHPDAGRPGSDRFRQDIELFIGDVLYRKIERAEPAVREAMRETLVLERDAVWAEVEERVQAHLRRATLTGRPPQTR